MLPDVFLFLDRGLKQQSMAGNYASWSPFMPHSVFIWLDVIIVFSYEQTLISHTLYTHIYITVECFYKHYPIQHMLTTKAFVNPLINDMDRKRETFSGYNIWLLILVSTYYK